MPLAPSGFPSSWVVLFFVIVGVLTDAIWVLFLRGFVSKFFRK
jgi:hypothetical protein